ncbi:hypothetical protein DPMN_047556 [Dreissena polymorpha]|uniref:Uncharacterized protein n=1 Tax=Dreissena polymorpha TaxID=45954 RepID=A0A9D4I1Z6_DREPO|nr:hypothetical protein DPMN_047556 [Dreissena polymorpha]
MEELASLGNREEIVLGNFKFVNYQHIVNEAANADVEVAGSRRANIQRLRRFVHHKGYLEEKIKRAS